MLKKHILKSLKVSIAAILAIFVAAELGLKYSATAGIITVLSIQNTKRETVKSAENRWVAFFFATVLSWICYKICGVNLIAFAIYLFLFATLCYFLGLGEALVMNSVLVSHYLAEGNMTMALFLNELLLFIIGAGFGILVNLHLQPKNQQFDRLAKNVDEGIKTMIHAMAEFMKSKDYDFNYEEGFANVEASIREAKLCAAANYNNSLTNEDTLELDYVRMREQQSIVLHSMYENIKSIMYFPKQAEQIAALLEEVEDKFHRNNTVEELLTKLENLFDDMESQELPITREEFEARAILFYIMMQIKNVLLLKREFVLGLDKKDRR